MDTLKQVSKSFRLSPLLSFISFYVIIHQTDGESNTLTFGVNLQMTNLPVEKLREN